MLHLNKPFPSIPGALAGVPTPSTSSGLNFTDYLSNLAKQIPFQAQAQRLFESGGKLPDEPFRPFIPIGTGMEGRSGKVIDISEASPEFLQALQRAFAVQSARQARGPLPPPGGGAQTAFLQQGVASIPPPPLIPGTGLETPNTLGGRPGGVPPAPSTALQDIPLRVSLPSLREAVASLGLNPDEDEDFFRGLFGTTRTTL